MNITPTTPIHNTPSPTTLALVKALPLMLADDMLATKRVWTTWRQYYLYMMTQRRYYIDVPTEDYGSVTINIEGNARINDDYIEQVWDTITKQTSLLMDKSIIPLLHSKVDGYKLDTLGGNVMCLKAEYATMVVVCTEHLSAEDQVEIGVYTSKDWYDGNIDDGIMVYNLDLDQADRVLRQLAALGNQITN